MLRDLPIAQLKDVASYYQDISPVVRGVPYGKAHAFLGCVENAKVIGSGSLIVDGKLIVHGLSTGNYAANIQQQLAQYTEVPYGDVLDEECTLVWGHPNFGHWLITYLMRVPLQGYHSGAAYSPLLIHNSVPRKYLEWLKALGYDDFRFADDAVTVRKLWVPSVLCYRGHYEDMNAYIYPESVHDLRDRLVDQGEPRTRIYISRARSQWRKLENEDELVAMLEANGIVRVFMEELSMRDQLDLVSSAELIVIHLGGGSPITMFAPTDCKIVEIAAPNVVGTFGSRCWADILGQPFVRINATPTKKTGPLPTDWDAVVNVKEVNASL